MRHLGWGSAMALAIAFGLGLGSGCSSSSSHLEPISAGCSLNSDCESPLVCVFARCHEACRTSSDCNPMGERCVPGGADGGAYNVCQLPEETTCSGASCVGDLVCGTDEQCRAPCGSSEGCIAGQTCTSVEGLSACFDPSNAQDRSIVGGPDGGVSDASAIGDGSSADADATVSSDLGPLVIPNVVNVTPTGGIAADGGTVALKITSSTCTSTTASCNVPAPTMVTTSGGGSAALYQFDSLDIEPNASLRFTGSLPVILVVRTTAQILGQILVNATTTTAGPGGFGGMNGGRGAGAEGSIGAYTTSGGGGASYCGQGGSGGASGAEAPGGTIYPTTGDPTTLIPLVGGSAGGGTGLGTNANIGGGGGGAIEIWAGTSISVGLYGVINAGGGGALPGEGNGNGGGGGSGGAILLEAPSVTVYGVLAANGGGGSVYANTSNSPGADGMASAQPALGAGLSGHGSAGAVTGGGSGPADDASVNSLAGTGGGGGAGRIRINTTNMSATIDGAIISPDLTTSCATQGKLTVATDAGAN